MHEIDPGRSSQPTPHTSFAFPNPSTTPQTRTPPPPPPHQIPPGFAMPTPVALAGTVVKGFGRGSRDLAVPTANIDPAPLQGVVGKLPRGVFFGWAKLEVGPGEPAEDGAVHKMVMNVGRRPTVNTGGWWWCALWWLVGG